MDVKSFEVVVGFEKSARRLFSESVWENYRCFCIACKSRREYRVRRQIGNIMQRLVVADKTL